MVPKGPPESADAAAPPPRRRWRGLSWRRFVAIVAVVLLTMAAIGWIVDIS